MFVWKGLIHVNIVCMYAIVIGGTMKYKITRFHGSCESSPQVRLQVTTKETEDGRIDVDISAIVMVAVWTIGSVRCSFELAIDV